MFYQWLSSGIVRPDTRVGQICAVLFSPSAVGQLLHGLPRRAFAVGGLRVPLYLGERRMAGNRRDLICAATDLGEASRCRLAQAVRRYVRAPGCACVPSRSVIWNGSRSISTQQHSTYVALRMASPPRIQSVATNYELCVSFADRALKMRSFSPASAEPRLPLMPSIALSSALV
jgi:hypothetical protein